MALGRHQILADAERQVKERCIFIPALGRESTAELLRKLSGETLVERTLHTARACAPGQDIFVWTDNEEIELVTQRNQAECLWQPHSDPEGGHAALLAPLIRRLAARYEAAIVLSPRCPLVTWVDVEEAWKKYRRSGAARLVSVRRVRQNIWHGGSRSKQNLPETLLAGGGRGHNFLIETPAIGIISLNEATEGRRARALPYPLHERGLAILTRQDWWICERLLQMRHIVFVVAGYPAIGLGHVYRALMLANAITSHRISFVCTRESALAALNVAGRDYRVTRQEGEPLWKTALDQRPDLVVNDFLDTDADYVERIQAAGIPCVNFEDKGPGSAVARLVINALENGPECAPNLRCGPRYFCLRDEFAQAARNELGDSVKTLLITFGGTDPANCTARVLKIVEPVCRALGIAIRIVAGPGYAHRKQLEHFLASLENPQVSFSWATNIMSRMMEGADLAICAAGRTVYELAHMRVPGIVIAQHEREATHDFARPRNGFAFAGIASQISDLRIRNMFLAMLKQKRRALYWERQGRWTFAGNKERVIDLVLSQLNTQENS